MKKALKIISKLNRTKLKEKNGSNFNVIKVSDSIGEVVDKMSVIVQISSETESVIYGV